MNYSTCTKKLHPKPAHLSSEGTRSTLTSSFSCSLKSNERECLDQTSSLIPHPVPHTPPRDSLSSRLLSLSPALTLPLPDIPSCRWLLISPTRDPLVRAWPPLPNVRSSPHGRWPWGQGGCQAARGTAGPMAGNVAPTTAALAWGLPP